MAQGGRWGGSSSSKMPPGPGIYGPSSLGRSCGAAGYSNLPHALSTRSGAGTFLPSAMTATSAAANRLYLSRFDDFRPMLRFSRGNGEDLTFAHAATSNGGVRVAVGRCAGERALAQSNPKQWRDACATIEGEIGWVRGDPDEEANAVSRTSATRQYHQRPGHYELRARACKCLSREKTREALSECVESDPKVKGEL